MVKCYSWNTNILDFTDVNGNKYHLAFRGDKTIVSGKSATGKTLLCTMLNNYLKDNNTQLKPYDTDNLFIVSSDNKDKIIRQTGKLIIIDRAEFILDEAIVSFINRDRGNNRYLIFLRKPMGIELSPNHFAELVEHNGTLELKYDYAEAGWF